MNNTETRNTEDIKSTTGRLGELIAGAPQENRKIPGPLVSYVKKDAEEGHRNRVLNDMLAGRTAFEIDDIADSRKLFDDAYQQINTIYAGNPDAEKARSTFVPEAHKDFKGEPYERAMVGYYAGLSEWIAGDSDNAMAYLKWGEFQDTMSAAENYQSDMALHYYLQAWISHCNRDDANTKTMLESALHARGTLPKLDQRDNALLIYESGGSPVKSATGKYNEELSYQEPTQLPAEEVTFKLDRQKMKGGIAEDVYWQATTLGGRAVDKILAGKAEFKDSAHKVGEAADAGMQTGLAVMGAGAYSGNNDMAQAGAIGGLISAFVKLGATIAEKAAKPEADSRSWSNLPSKIFISTTHVDKSPAKIIAISDRSSTPVPLRVYKTGSCYLAWGTDQSSQLTDSNPAMPLDEIKNSTANKM